MWIYTPFFLTWWGHELSQTQDRRMTRWSTRIHGILPCHPSPLRPNFKVVSWASRPRSCRRWNHNWSAFTSFETSSCKQAGFQVSVSMETPIDTDPAFWSGALWDFSAKLNVVPSAIGSLFLSGRFGLCARSGLSGN
jgi:hypothetical protein